MTLARYAIVGLLAFAPILALASGEKPVSPVPRPELTPGQVVEIQIEAPPAQ